MSVPADMMSRIQQGQQRGAPLPGGGQPGPAASPMATPQKKEGTQQRAVLRVHIAMNMLEQALVDMGAETKDGTAVLNSLRGLARHFGDKDTSDLVPAEMKQMFESMPQMGGGSPMQQQIAKMRAGNGPAQMPPSPAPMPMPQ